MNTPSVYDREEIQKLEIRLSKKVFYEKADFPAVSLFPELLDYPQRNTIILVSW